MPVTTSQIIGGCLELLFSLCLPVGLIIWLCCKRKLYWRALLAGAVCQGIFLLITNLLYYGSPIPGKVSQNNPLVKASIANPTVYNLVFTLIFALFTAFIAYLALRFLSKKRLTLRDGLVFGVGLWTVQTVLDLAGILSVKLDFTDGIVNTFFFTSSLPKGVYGALSTLATLIITACVMLLISLAIQKKKLLPALAGVGISYALSMGFYFLRVVPLRWEGTTGWAGLCLRLVAAVLLAFFAAKELKKEGSEA